MPNWSSNATKSPREVAPSKEWSALLKAGEEMGGDAHIPRGSQALATSLHTCDGQPTSELITCQKKAVCPLATPFSLLPPGPACLHWEMVSWLSRTWYMTDCTFQCCKRGYPDTSLKFTIPARERTWGLSATAQGCLPMGMAAAPHAMAGAMQPVGWEEARGKDCAHTTSPQEGGEAFRAEGQLLPSN